MYGSTGIRSYPKPHASVSCEDGAVITFTITKNGGISDIKIVANSGAIPLDRAAVGAIQASNPFPRLPDDYDDDHIVLQFTFLYNMS